jgi:hypothetical protein
VSFIAWLRDVFRPLRRTDPEFGDMLYLRQVQWWEACIRFAPTGTELDVFVHADEAGPSESQRRFLRDLTDRYGSLMEELDERLRAVAATMDLPSDVRFEPGLIEVPPAPGGDARWEIVFATVPVSLPLIQSIVVAMEGWTPVDVYCTA